MIGELHHVGISVSDLDKSVKFYTEVLGMEVDYKAYHKGEKISSVVGVPLAELDVIVVKKGEVRLELIEYKNKKGLNDIKIDQTIPGLVHIALCVTDINNEYKKISSLGYKFNSPPMVTRENGPKICYFIGPDNVVIELYEKNSVNQ
jgi:catechol 2,3-dioxygenase-like lactoylglutathione lyase family enzyme